MKKGVSQEIKQRIEAIERLPTREALYNRYFIDMLTFRKICIKWNINTRTLMRLFTEYAFESRKGGEAIKTQWLNAENRKIKTSNNMAAMRKKYPHWAIGIKRPDAAILMKTKNPMFNAETRERASKKTVETMNANPKLYGQYHKKPTRCEKKVFDFLISKNIPCVVNELINDRFIDIFIPLYNIGIECVHHARFPLSFDRHKKISDNNIKIIYCTNDFIYSSNIYVLCFV